MILRFIICLLAMLAISAVMGFILALFSINLKDESGRSLLYDDPEYFIHDEPKWLNDDKKADMQQDGKKEFEDDD